MAGARTATASTARVDVLSALRALLCAKLAEARCARGGRWGRTHADIREGGLVAAVRGRLGGSVQWDSKMLLGHLLGELKVVGGDVGHLALHLEIAQMLLWLDHAHIDILLVCCGNLLLLLL